MTNNPSSLRHPSLGKHLHSNCRDCGRETYYDGPALGWLHVDSVIDRLDHLPSGSGPEVRPPEVRNAT